MFIAALSFLYGPLLGRQIVDYTPFLAFGLIAWTLISQIVGESCTVFVVNGHIIRQMKAPLSIYIFNMIWRNMPIFVRNMALYVLIAVLFTLIPPGPRCFSSRARAYLPQRAVDRHAALHAVHALPLIPPIITTIMQMMLVLTPILWHADQVPGREAESWLQSLPSFRGADPGAPARQAGVALDLGRGDSVTLGGLAVALPSRRFRDRIVSGCIFAAVAYLNSTLSTL